MSDDIQEPVLEEIDVLKKRADQLGIKYHPSIGLEKLKDKVNEAINKDPEEPAEPEAVEEVAAAPVPRSGMTKGQETRAQRQQRLRRESTKLVRISINCMNPNMREHEGMIFTVSNSIVGTHKKYVPFNTPWHVPKIIADHIEERQCQIFTTTKGPRGNKIRKGKLIKEYAVEYLPALTKKELDDLAKKQAMANNIDS